MRRTKNIIGILFFSMGIFLSALLINPEKALAEEVAKNKTNPGVGCQCTEAPYLGMQGTYDRCQTIGGAACTYHGPCETMIQGVMTDCGEISDPIPDPN